MKRYRITYKQRFMGEVLVDSYERVVGSRAELDQAVDALYSDPHVYSVTCKELKDDERA